MPTADDTDHQRSAVFVRLAAGLGAFAFLGGLLTLLGWATGSYRLMDWWNTGITMKANAAASALCAGAALFLLALRPGAATAVRVFASLSALLGGLTLLEHLSGLNFGIDTLLFDEAPGAAATASPGRMGPPASTSFLLAGVTMVLLSRGGSPRWRWLPGAPALVLLCISLLSLIGYLYGAELMYAVPRVSGIAVQTAVMIFAVGLGLLLLAPGRQPLCLFLDSGAAGVLGRIALPLVILLPLGLGWLRVLGENAELYDAAFGTAMRTMSEIVLLLALLWWALRSLSIYEKALRESERRLSETLEALRETDRRKDEFLATLSHELRNPLAPIMTSLDLLERGERGGAAPAGALATMRRQLSHLVRLVDDLLDLHRITQSRIELRRQRLTLATVVEDAVSQTRRLFAEKNQRLTIDLGETPLWLDGDPARLSQVFANLLNNASRYTGSGGRVLVRAREHNGDVEVVVEDNGMGIPADRLEDIFRMFSQLGGSGTGGSDGLGIGLHLVRRLVEMHGGTVQARSAGLGQGSSFLVRLPGAPAARPEGLAVPPAAAVAAPQRILVVDDNSDAARSLALLLGLDGNEVRIAGDGRQALEVAERFVPQVILLDIGMPVMDGYEACRALRMRESAERPFIIALTGWGQAEDRRRTREAGFDAHLVKPVDHGVLTRLLGELQKTTS